MTGGIIHNFFSALLIAINKLILTIISRLILYIIKRKTGCDKPACEMMNYYLVFFPTHHFTYYRVGGK